MPLVSVLLAVHDGAPFVSQAVESILRQSVGDLELIVVDDASTDDTRRLLAAIRDPRIVVLRNNERAGLAASLNRALDEAQGRYVARLDADDIAAPERLERQLARIRAKPPVAVVGSSVVDLDESGRLGRTHLLPDGPTALRWHALFSSPFFHPTVLVDREVLERHGLRYDPAYLESEDYDLWTRLFTVADGSNLAAPLVRKRVHAGQASTRRSDLQRSFQRQVALREIARVAPELDPDDAELAWSFACRGAGAPRGGERAYLMLLEAFEQRHGVDRAVRAAAARRLARSGRVTEAFRLAPDLPVSLVLDGMRRPWHRWATRRQTAPLGPGPAPSAPVPVTVVSPEPTPYRSPLFDRVAARADVDLTVVYAART